MSHCNQAGITGITLVNLGPNVEVLNINHCNPQTIERATQLYGVTEADPIVKKHPQLGGRKKYNRKLTKRKRVRKSRKYISP
jgi:hypothetical protein